MQFNADHPKGWSGGRMIYAPTRNTDPATVRTYMDNAVKLIKAYPDFVLGFDLVGPEDFGRPLIEFIAEILAGLKQNPGLRIFLHAGETNWHGSTTDLV